MRLQFGDPHHLHDPMMTRSGPVDQEGAAKGVRISYSSRATCTRAPVNLLQQGRECPELISSHRAGDDKPAGPSIRECEPGQGRKLQYGGSIWAFFVTQLWMGECCFYFISDRRCLQWCQNAWVLVDGA